MQTSLRKTEGRRSGSATVVKFPEDPGRSPGDAADGKGYTDATAIGGERELLQYGKQ